MISRNPHGLLPRHFIVLDLETTGLSPARDEIVEIAALKVDTTCDTHQRYHCLVRTEFPIPPQAVAVHGITDELLRTEGLPHEEAIKGLHQFIGDMRIVCHNSRFDLGFLQQSFAKYGLPFRNPSSCTLKMTRRAFPDLPSYKLEDVVRFAGWDSSGSHRALTDCLNTARVFINSVGILASLE